MGKRRVTQSSANEVLFEQDFVLRSLGRIGYDANVALTELVANGWDAGAHRAEVIIPPSPGGLLTVEDDGHGMTEEQFRTRWMKLGYNRQSNQGDVVEFPPERADWKRRAFGRNGVGRHGLLCFSDEYEVETWTGGTLSTFVIGTRNRPSPFFIKSHSTSVKKGHGTRLKVEVQRHLPNPDTIRTVLSARFLHDPQFVVSVNGESIPLHDHEGLIEKQVLHPVPGMTATAFVVDATTSANSNRYQGIAFWVNNRLVGAPGWSVGSTPILDGRLRFAKRHAIVVKAGGEWLPHVEQDWSRFKSNEATDKLFACVSEYVAAVVEKLSTAFIEENSEEALYRNREDLRALPMGSMLEVAQFTQSLVHDQPAIPPETLAKAVRTVIKLQQARSGANFLDRLLRLDEHDIDSLDRMLAQWTVQDALTVLDEIDARLSVIAAIEKLCGDEQADELHTLHPLVTHARWLFGPEFDSSFYASNNSLRSVAIRVFKADPTSLSFFNAARRPDLIALPNSTISIVGTENIDSSTEALVSIRDVLLIELKKGRSAITHDDMRQAEDYALGLINSGGLEATTVFRAFVVGHSVKQGTPSKKDVEVDGVKRATIVPCSYDRLALTANRRLHGLKSMIPSRYEDLSGYALVQRVMKTPSQAPLDLAKATDSSTSSAAEGEKASAIVK